ncbi:hypothetical protein AOL_s00110g2 [Orbilia oligospora ATCC 24927]|uniref:Uncharacterized protein n=2 Tax=Orbilia oligospora TaxID=2813651 RepID=G1XKI2_ARTOA|nr:hypothetical protein AOL_s00110g2 [Orbilia oligospora ATCC 24927]EGX46178.1 hypothetical protein AOL_s00110g2 [Orbilia oligospora ATCC 24927]KAF3281283.1 hypothetical protein TWF970_002437 [Orbilia oligospora]
MNLFFFFLVLVSPASSIPLSSVRSSALASTLPFPGDKFIRTLLRSHAPKFATGIPLAVSPPITQRNLALFRTAALNLNITHPVTFLDDSRKFHYPVFETTKCQLGKDTDNVTPFLDSTTLGTYFKDIFQMIPSWTNGDTVLSRFDLFHGHLFANPSTGAVGVVFHSKEYPAENTETFPFNLGYCQINSNVTFVQKIMRKRNIIWIIDDRDRTSLWRVDMGVRTGDSAIDTILGGEPFYTLYEGSLGNVVADLYYLNGLELSVSLY